MWSTPMWYTAFGAIGEISTPEKKADSDWPKVMVDYEPLLESWENCFHILWGLLLHVT